jgi:ParB-like chromosome segregation protein Spo0J
MAAPAPIINREFAALCPPLAAEERRMLEADIEANGCLVPLVIWERDGRTILDGHNRYEICKKRNAPYKTTLLALKDFDAAKNWIIDNQLARRNLTEDQKSYLRGKRHVAEKKEPHRPKKGDSESPLKTAAKLAAEYQVDERTIQRDAKYANAIDTLESNVGGGTKDAILSGELPIKRADVVKLADLPPAKQKAAIAKGAPGIKSAVSTPRTPTTIADTVSKELKETADRIDGWYEQYGSIKAMFDSELWDGLDLKYVVDMVTELHQLFRKLDKEMQEYVKGQEKKLRQGSGKRPPSRAVRTR